MKVLVSDKLGEAGIQLFEEAQGIEVDVNTGLEPAELKKIIGDYDAIVIRSATKVTEELLDAAPNLKVVGRAGIGLDNVDIPAATKRGVVVMNTPGGNVVTTAEHAISMMLSLTRNIPRGTASLKAGKWDKKLLQGKEIFNKTLGVIGFGNIGSIAADRARGLRMNVIVADPHVTPERIEKAGFEAVSLDELYERSDYITVHVPKMKETIGLLNKDAFAKMKKGVMVINCARGGIVDEADLYDAIQEGKVAGAALDVFATEPPGVIPLFELDNVICTPHLGASTAEAQTNVAVAVAEQIIAYLQTGTVINAVNAPSVTGDLLEKLKPLLTLGDRMGCLQAQLAQGPVKSISIEYYGDFRGLDLSPVTTAILKGFLTPALKDDVNFVNAGMLAQERGVSVTETTQADSKDFNNLIKVIAKSDAATHTVSGTIYGKAEPKIVRIDSFRVEMVPEGHVLLIHNIDKPGAIGSVGSMLGEASVNIARMQVGQEEDGNRNFIVMETDTETPDDVVAKLRELPLVKSVITVEL
ncbi:phosphoglycerate dehydrogenase [Desulfatibacillum aliphaticivorans]|uniref:phosphoglycerate dehydrogenase n=1 Tax=Desulfatibacillum aliphaticivorans TaxID=218208 RepID=UPI00041EC04F|nr:phosphoglycerate dehydrogenase [Desulfatibacillum aliphaticivorans]